MVYEKMKQEGMILMSSPTSGRKCSDSLAILMAGRCESTPFSAIDYSAYNETVSKETTLLNL